MYYTHSRLKSTENVSLCNTKHENRSVTTKNNKLKLNICLRTIRVGHNKGRA